MTEAWSTKPGAARAGTPLQGRSAGRSEMSIPSSHPTSSQPSSMSSQPSSTSAAPAARRPTTLSRLARYAGALAPKPTLQNKVLAGMASTALLLIMAAVAVVVADRETAVRERSQQTVNVLIELGRLRSALTDAESGQRGYLLSGDARYLEPWHGAERSIRQSLAVLRALSAAPDSSSSSSSALLTGADPVRDAELAVLSDLVDTKLNELATLVETQHKKGKGAALQLVLEDSGRQSMDAARASLARLEARELELRALRLRDLAQARGLLLFVIFMGCGLSALLNIVVQVSIKRDLEERDRDAVLLAAQAEKLDESESTLARQMALIAEANTALATRSFELEEAHDRAEQLVQDLSQSNRDLTQFAYVASHDLKAPLRGIAHLATWIEEDTTALSPQSKDHLHLMRQRITRMEAMIEGVLRYSHAGRTGDGVVDVELGQLLRDAVELAAPPAGVAVEVVGGFFPVAVGRIQLQQVVLNLVENAIKHGTPHGGVVRVTAATVTGPPPGIAHPDRTPSAARLGSESGWFRIGVRDDGPGIDPRYHERIFGLFQTLQPKDRVEGAGIGLAVVKKLVELQGGRVQVDSAEGQGTEISFTWPRQPRKRSAPSSPSAFSSSSFPPTTPSSAPGMTMDVQTNGNQTDAQSSQANGQQARQPDGAPHPMAACKTVNLGAVK